MDKFSSFCLVRSYNTSCRRRRPGLLTAGYGLRSTVLAACCCWLHALLSAGRAGSVASVALTHPRAEQALPRWIRLRWTRRKCRRCRRYAAVRSPPRRRVRRPQGRARVALVGDGISVTGFTWCTRLLTWMPYRPLAAARVCSATAAGDAD